MVVNFGLPGAHAVSGEIPDLISLYENRKDVMVIGVAMEFSDPDVVMKFVESMSISIRRFSAIGVSSQLERYLNAAEYLLL
ncbi:MAG: hypothetical protein KIS65_05505 [Nitrosomonas sp.]|nr:hypothetical protein [Nitrosomonas sp.]